MNHSDMSTCIVCARSYNPCLSCQNQGRKQSWRMVTDTITCYKIFLALSQYNQGYISKDEARRQLEAVDFHKQDLKPSVQRQIDEILS
ncbi:hypothetical protein AALB16_15880 [Lachnospiraceae bacterium 62-35]